MAPEATASDTIQYIGVVQSAADCSTLMYCIVSLAVLQLRQVPSGTR
jgi:hypothetical protein